LGHRLSALQFDGLDSMSTTALQVLLIDVEFTVDVSSSISTLRNASEHLFNLLKNSFSTPGLGTCLSKNPEYVDTIHEVEIKYSSYIAHDPMTWLALIIGQTVYMLRAANKSQEIFHQFATNTVQPDLVNKFNNL
jgi:hypothetical protein